MITNNVYVNENICPICGEFLEEHDEGFMYCPLCVNDEKGGEE